MMSEERSPWCVTELDDFLFYCCPECQEKHQSKGTFLEHALHDHPISKVYLEKYKVKEVLIENNIIISEIFDDNVCNENPIPRRVSRQALKQR